MSHRVLVIGGYYDQINTLVEKGFTVVALLPIGRYKEMVPRAEVKTYFVNVTDKEQCQVIATKEHKHNRFSAVMSHYELSIPIAANVVSFLGIPGPCRHAAQIIRDKTRTRELANRCSDVDAPYDIVVNKEQVLEFISEFGSSVIKPSAGVGGRDIQLIRTPVDIDYYLSGIDLKSETFQIEQFIEGFEFSVEGFMDLGGHTIVAVTGKSQPRSPTFVETTHVQSKTIEAWCSNELKLRINILLEEFYRYVGYQLGATHSEFILTPEGKLYLLEGHLRTGGFSIWELTRITTGVDLFLHHTLRLLGKDTVLTVQESEHSATITGLSCQPGRVHNVSFEIDPKDGLPAPTR
ncbi:ATP-grasp domain-containing protein [Vibrio campbellii]|uniref:ATP-grasp domain-containing protein n=1 Tax=Vibrio campbellii (strain ATCC BAA-1116) TaxID=2902295 RepID=A7N2D3_VIBC1|nr:ATP-grasp domain-containing protein [Vibrio campbellii]ABU73956.1 hypothetical protein VIBHAR_06063 [Vibrio campbellii ATCC BAA-1116]AGU98471.1 hypothetical protein M892_21590 [Vibrio campbellii ATCC BAA-1116]MBT0124167.1 ATP-grasp domain-containing protein [Vibrio campbellii]MBT0139099.1 ATP-grasp domain-containing protein [Vibrio campbellii]MBT0143799.1 ATP-grasp domain-containing protein [Vibrio campbellii]